MDEFYDLDADPQEVTNLVADPRASAALRAMKAELERFIAEGGKS